MKRARGFTLIELMIVVLVIAVLASLAFSAYNKQVRKGRRAEAKQVLADYSLRLEKWRSNHVTYTSTLSDFQGASPVPSGNYTIVVSFPASGTCSVGVNKGSANSYIITATTVPGTDQAKDTGCPTLVLASDCGTVSKTPAGCW